MNLKSIRYKHEKDRELRDRGHTIGDFDIVDFLLARLELIHTIIEGSKDGTASACIDAVEDIENVLQEE